MKLKLGESEFNAQKGPLLKAAGRKAFVIDNQTLKQMEQAGISEDVRKKLTRLKGRTFPNEGTFAEAAKAEVGGANFSDEVKTTMIQQATKEYSPKSKTKATSSETRESRVKRNLRRGRRKGR